MNQMTKEKLLAQKDRYINMVIERVKRDFKEDISIIGLTGSYSTHDFHEKSDIDLILINETDRAWEISTCFILKDVGFDIYCTPWSSRLEPQANLETPYISVLTDLEIIYVGDPDALERFKSLQARAKALLDKPADMESFKRGTKYLDKAKVAFSDLTVSEALGPVRYHSAIMAFELINALVATNNTYMVKGIKRYVEKLESLVYRPEDFIRVYFDLMAASNMVDIKASAHKLLKLTVDYLRALEGQWTTKESPTADNMRLTYEELWCNYRNKIIMSVKAKDPSYAFHAASGAQAFLDEMVQVCGCPTYDVMASFNSHKLEDLQRSFFNIMDDYRQVYESTGGKVNYYDDFDALYEDFMK